MSRLEHYGIWRDEGVDVLVTGVADRRLLANVTCHVCAQPLPARSLHPLPLGVASPASVFVCSPELALLQVAADMSRASGKWRLELLQLLTEFCGTFRIIGDETHYKCPPLTSAKALSSFVRSASGLYGSRNLEAVLPYVLDGAASPPEASLGLALSLPLKYGGEGLGSPELNRTLETNEAARIILGRDTITPDILYRSRHARRGGLPIEYDSVQFHSSREQAEYDELRRNAYAAMGMSCLLVKPRHLRSLTAFDAVAQTVRKNVGVRARPEPTGYLEKRRELHATLFGNYGGENCQKSYGLYG